MPLDDDRAALFAAAGFRDGDLAELRSSAVAFGASPHEDPTALHVVVGWVRTHSYSSNKSQHYRLIVDGWELDVVHHSLFRAIRDGGAYRVFFVPEKKELRGLEPVAPDEVPDAVAEAARAAGLDPRGVAARSDPGVAAALRDGIGASLGRALEFTPADLVANRAGNLSEREQTSLRGSALGCFVGAVFVAIIGALVVGAAMSDKRIAAVIAAVMLLAVVLLVRAGLQRRVDANAGRVLSGVGLIPRTEWPLPRITLENGLIFTLPREALSVRGHHPDKLLALSYRVYYAPESDDLMSVEPVDLTALFEP